MGYRKEFEKIHGHAWWSGIIYDFKQKKMVECPTRKFSDWLEAQLQTKDRLLKRCTPYLESLFYEDSSDKKLKDLLSRLEQENPKQKD